MKILFTRFPLESIKNGGAEKQTLTLMQGLMERGHAVAFAGSCTALLKMCREHGIPTVELSIGNPPVTKWGAVSFAWRKAGMRKKLKLLLDQFGIRNEKFGIVMLSLSEKLLLTDIAVEAGAKVFWLEHDPIGRWLTQNPWLPLLRKQSAHATTITVSELSKKMYEQLGFEKVVAIPNGVEETAMLPFHEAPKDPRLPKIKIGCIARLSREKGVDLLIKAVNDCPGIALDIVGKGPESVALHAQTNSVTNINAFLQDINLLYANIDALVLPSRDHDPFGLVVAEAMMRGIPVIVTDACGIAGYLTDGKDAVIVKAGSAEALREGIERMLNVEYRMEIGKKGRETAMRTFTVSRMVDEYEKIFNNA